MKKIYILTAVFALLALSLNAQTQLKVGKDGIVVYPKTSTEQVEQGEKVVTPPDGYFRMGPSRASTTPVTPPYTNSFNNNNQWNWWEVINNNGGNTWTRNNGGYAQYQYDSNQAADDWLVTAPVYLEAGKVYSFSINAWASGYTERLEVRMVKDVHTADALSVGKIVIPYTNVTSTSNSNSLSNTKVRVNETGYYYFGIHAVSPADQYRLYVDNLNIGIGADPVHDLKAYVSAPTQIYAGQKATINVKVTNLGDFPETGYTVKIYANGNEISSETVTESLLLGASKMFNAEYTTVAAEAYTSVNFTATVTCANTDADGTNNNATAAMAVLAVPAPVNVAATDGDGNSTVTWEAPNINPITVTEDFENLNVFPSFGLGGITASQHTGAFGEWTLYDSTGTSVWGSNQEDWENEEAPQAWMPFDPIAIESATTTHSGEQFIESICPASSTIASDSWLISPELSGNAQTITFYERVITSAYGDETYEVLASSTDNNPSSFTSVATFADQVLDWTLRSADLPAGTKYFAIRHTSTDIFGLLIDDITYEIAGEQPVSYNVYMDGNLVGNVNANNTLSYNLSNVPHGEHECSISAVYDGNIESALVSDSFASGPKTATPTITYTETNGTVVITATGEGTVTLTVDGQTAIGNSGTATITIVKSPVARTVTATATAKAEGEAESDPATQDITIPALTGTNTEPAEGMLRLHLLIVDQLKQEIPADNSHPDHYGYVLRYEPTGGEKKESSSVRVDIQKTDETVKGKYTLDQIDKDTDRELTMGIYSADVEFDLSDENPDVDFYILERENSKDAEPSFNVVSKLQQTTNFTYVEMLQDSENEGEEYQAGPHYYYDEVLTGEYGDYVRYAPVVSTWGIDRRYFEDDGLDNTYGAPIWKTGVAEVTMSSATAERQKNAWNSVNWTDEDGNDASLYILDKVMAVGKLPDYSTVQYEPYMFRIFVESPNGKLRNFKVIEGGDGQYDGEHLEASATSEADKHGPICVWSGYIKDITEDNSYGMSLGITDNQYTFTKNKVDRTDGSHDGGIGNEEWDKDAVNAMFGALDALETDGNGHITEGDLKIFVRFYYNVKGMAAGHEVSSNNNRSPRAEGDNHAGYGAESAAKAPDPATSVFEISYHGEIVGQTYYNIQGMESDKPFDGVNIVVTRYSDGTTSVSKVVR